MLKKFILNVFSSFVGAWLAIILLIAGLMIFIFGMIGSVASKEVRSVGKHSVMKIVLGGAIEEAESASEFDYTILMTGKIEHPQTLKTLLAALQKAKTNSDIDALYIECQGVGAAPATLDALRDGIKDFKKSGKRVFAYGDNLTMGDYYVASTADVVYLNPAGNLNIQGLNGTSLYFKGLLDKLGIEVQAVRVGTFKSAIEPYTSSEMSEPARRQLEELYGEMWEYITEGIVADRKIKSAALDSLVNRFLFLDKASTVKQYDLVDDCLYKRQVLKLIADYVGKDVEDLNFVSPETVVGQVVENTSSGDQIAVLYAVGDIAEMEGAGINCNKLVPVIVSLAENDDVKGMVLRVNSPGGSVFGSDQIGEALDYFKSQGKPLAVSMGDYAASGGYWISAGADRIFADPLTITGSIGIFGLVPNVQKLAANLGITPQTVGTNPGMLFPSIFYPMSEEQQAALQRYVERGYEQFITRVAEGRHRSPDYIRSIAEGRVWNAMKAKELGLVDELGTLAKAVDWTAGKAGVKSPNIVSYPTPETNFWSIISSSPYAEAMGVKTILERLSSQTGDEKIIGVARWFLLQSHVQARSPYYLISL